MAGRNVQRRFPVQKRNQRSRTLGSDASYQRAYQAAPLLANLYRISRTKNSKLAPMHLRQTQGFHKVTTGERGPVAEAPVGAKAVAAKVATEAKHVVDAVVGAAERVEKAAASSIDDARSKLLSRKAQADAKAPAPSPLAALLAAIVAFFRKLFSILFAGSAIAKEKKN
eukprot:tig00000692_g3237.t1